MTERETQLLEFWKGSAKLWALRSAVIYGATGGEETKIDVAKRKSEAARMVRAKVERLAMSQGRRRARKIHGTMTLTEKPDRLCAPTVNCAWCGKSFSSQPHGNRPAAIYCSRTCSHAAWRARKIIANG
jgi:hypothetical protein